MLNIIACRFGADRSIDTRPYGICISSRNSEAGRVAVWFKKTDWRQLRRFSLGGSFKIQSPYEV